MLTINVVCIGKIKEKFFKDAIDEYSKRLSKYCKLNILELPDEKIPDKLNQNLENDIKTPPMSEEIVLIDGKLYQANESASNKYVFGKFTGGKYLYSSSF